MTKLNKIIILSTISLLMTACSVDRGLNYQSPLQAYQTSSWHKEGVDKSMTNDKIGHCKIEVGASRLSKEEGDKLVNYCMKADGYRLVTETKYR